MKVGQWVLLASACLLGLVLGSFFGPRPNTPTSERATKEDSQLAAKSANQRSPHSFSSSQASAQSEGEARESSFPRELTVENVVLTFRDFFYQSDANPMQIARFGARLTEMDEAEVTALLKGLQKPLLAKDGSTIELAPFVTEFVFCRLCELNGPEAMRILHSGLLGSDPMRNFGAVGMTAWIAANPESAQSWFEKTMRDVDEVSTTDKSDDSIGSSAILIGESDIRGAYLRGMLSLRPEKIEENIASYQSETVRINLQIGLFDELMKKANTAGEIVTLLNKDTFQDYPTAYQEFADELARVDFDAARSWAESQPISRKRDLMNFSIGATLAKDDPEKAATWLLAQELSPETKQGSRTSAIINYWPRQDLEGAASWLLEQPNDSSRDISEFQIAGRASEVGDWEAAFRWNEDISNESLRKRSLNRLFDKAWNHNSSEISPKVEPAARASGHWEKLKAYLEGRGSKK